MKAARGNRNGHRDATMILVTYRHGLRRQEVCQLRWDQYDFQRHTLHVNRTKNGIESVHPVGGEEMRALRKLQREQPESRYVFVSECLAPLSEEGFLKMVKRAGVAAKLSFSVHPPQDPDTPYLFPIKVETKIRDVQFCQSILCEIEFNHKETNYTGSHTEVGAESARDVKVTTIATAPASSSKVNNIVSGTISRDDVFNEQGLWRREDDNDDNYDTVTKNEPFFSHTELKEGDQREPLFNINFVEHNSIFTTQNLSSRRELFYVSGEPGTRAFLISERLANTEPSRVCRRLQLLRDWSYDESKENFRKIFARGA